jgi:arylsulfatase A-like enzyme
MQRSGLSCAVLVVLSQAVACGGGAGSGPAPISIRLVDLFDAKSVEGASRAAAPLARIEWRFDASTPSDGGGKFAATRGWEPGPGVEALSVRDGSLTGRSTTNFPVLHLERTTGLDNPDILHAVEIRMRASDGANVSLQTLPAPTVNLTEVPEQARRVPWAMQSPLQAGDVVQTYTITPLQPIVLSRIRHILLRPTDAAGATIAIESIRLISRKEHLASIPAGLGWQGLEEVYQESLVAHAPETMRFIVQLPERPWLDLAVGTIEDGPVTFRVSARPQGSTDDRDSVKVDYTVTRPHRWSTVRTDLSRLAGRAVTISFELQSEAAGALGFWGAPVIRQLGGAPPVDQSRAETTTGPPPQGVILIHADTLRRDHLNFYGHSRETAPVMARMAQEGVLFNHALAQASWTKVSTPSIMTGLYPSTHGVREFNDRLPSSATTVAEVYRKAGYATISLSSTAFTGQFTNLHQGFEQVHENGSLPGRGTPLSSKTSREFVDRLIGWIESHREVPFFAYLHVFDPHHPYEPYSPYNSKWGDSARMDEHRKNVAAVTKLIEDPFMKARSLPTRDEVIKAGLNPEQYVTQELDWYDGSIRAMDVEFGRLFEQLRRMGLDERTAVVLTSDHGTEFQEHGRFWHGQSVYGELINVPLMVRWPTRLPPGRVIDDLVQSIDIMPTLLGLSGLEAPAGVQGQSLQPFLAPVPAGQAAPRTWPGWNPRPAISERDPTTSDAPPTQTRVSAAIIDGNWKLIHNTTRPPDLAEFELFDYYKDPLNKQNVASEHPEVVARLSKAIAGWRQMATAARIKPDAEATKGLSAEELQRLRSLGYVR